MRSKCIFLNRVYSVAFLQIKLLEQKSSADSSESSEGSLELLSVSTNSNDSTQSVDPTTNYELKDQAKGLASMELVSSEFTESGPATCDADELEKLQKQVS